VQERKICLTREIKKELNGTEKLNFLPITGKDAERMAEMKAYDIEQQSQAGKDTAKAIYTSGSPKRMLNRHSLGEVLIWPNIVMHFEMKLNLIDKHYEHFMK
jgi:hypothetical protein